MIRDGKGDKDRVTMLPLNVKNLLQRHLQEVKQLHERDLKQGFGSVYLPYALESTLMPIVNGIGNMYCPLRSVRLTHVRVLNGGIMSVHWCCSEP